MKALTSTTFKSVYASIGLHAVFVVLGSWAFYNNSIHTSLELTGNAGGGGRTISLTDINFVSKKSASAPVRLAPPTPVKAIEKSNFPKTVTKSVATTTTDTVSVTNGAVAAAVTGGSGTGVGSGAGNGSGSGEGDFDKGQLFGQIKKFYETRLGDTFNIRENQLIKIKLILSNEGDILDAIMVQGKLEMSALRRVLSVAKHIPLKNFWNSTSAYPKEIIVPLVLTPG